MSKVFVLLGTVQIIFDEQDELLSEHCKMKSDYISLIINSEY